MRKPVRCPPPQQLGSYHSAAHVVTSVATLLGQGLGAHAVVGSVVRFRCFRYWNTPPFFYFKKSNFPDKNSVFLASVSLEGVHVICDPAQAHPWAHGPDARR